MGTKMGFLPMEGESGVGGAICAGENYKPSSDGAKLYLNGGEDLSTQLSRVEAAGGKVICPKQKLRMRLATWLSLLILKAIMWLFIPLNKPDESGQF